MYSGTVNGLNDHRSLEFFKLSQKQNKCYEWSFRCVLNYFKNVDMRIAIADSLDFKMPVIKISNGLHNLSNNVTEPTIFKITLFIYAQVVFIICISYYIVKKRCI